MFANRMKLALDRRGITQSQLSAVTGIDRSVISCYLSGRYEPKNENLSKIAKVLKVSSDWLMGREETITPPQTKGVRLPVLGRVAAGIPIEAITDILDFEEVNEELLRDGAEYFALKIKGDSMEPRISNGDVVIVRKQEDCDSGQIAIVCVNGYEATCKKVIKQESGVMLLPLNPSYQPTYYTATQVRDLPITIIGRVIELRAKF